MFYPIKDLGQNFLLDREVAKKLVDSLEPSTLDTFVEIGPGLGVLTQELVNRVGDDARLYAVEIDKRFVETLSNVFINYPNVKVVEGDILKWLPDFKYEHPYKLLGSLPYYITSPIIHSVVKKDNRPEVAVMLIQKEVAEKVAAKEPDASYLSTFVQTFYDVTYLGKVGREKFKPSPKVDSGIIKLVKRQESLIPAGVVEKYEGFLHRGFSNPRKMLNKVFSKEELAKIGVEGNLRPQNLSAEIWAAAFKKLVHYEI